MREPRLPTSVAINIYWLGTSFMWNSIHPIVLPLLLLSFADQAKNTAYGILTFVGLIIALIVQPLSGAISDRTHHRWGRRRPWIALGSLLVLVCLGLLANGSSFWVVAVGYCLLQFSSNLAHGPAQGLLPDLVAREGRAKAAGLKNLFDMLGVVVAAMVSSRVMAQANAGPWRAIVIIMIVFITTTSLTCWQAREEDPLEDAAAARSTLSDQIRDLLRIRFSEHKSFFMVLLSRYFMLLGSFAIQSFGLFFFRDALQVESPARMVGNVMTAVGLSILIIAYPSGILAERLGRRPLAVLACGLSALGTGLLMFMHTPNTIWILGIVIGLGMGTFATVNWAWASDLVPAGSAGKYLGLTNLATAGSAATARLLGPVIDLMNRFHANAGYTALFIMAAVGALISLVLTLTIPDSHSSSPGLEHRPQSWLKTACNGPRHRSAS